MDLVIGLAYLSHREAHDYPAQDIALRGRPISLAPKDADASHLLVSWLLPGLDILLKGVNTTCYMCEAYTNFVTLYSHDITLPTLLTQIELKEVQRYLMYCRGLKFKKSSQQIAFWNEHLQLGKLHGQNGHMIPRG